MIGYAICGSFCTHAKSVEVLRQLVAQGEDVLTILSPAVVTTDTRFGTAEKLITDVENLTSKKAVTTIVEAEPLGPKTPLDALIIAPCTGNTLAKMANGITDTSVTMAAKAHMRTNRPLLIALATNDAMSANFANIGTMLARKNVYFVPMVQDDPTSKPHSLVADFARTAEAYEAMMKGRQLRPLIT